VQKVRVGFDHFLKGFEGARLGCLGELGHRLELLAGVLQAVLAGRDDMDLLWGATEDLYQSHVDEAFDSPLVVILVECLVGLEEVGVGRGVIALLALQHARELVDLGLENRHHVYRGGRGP